MPDLRAIPRDQQRVEPWANGAGNTTVVLREPDDANWRVRVSVATVDHDGPFSELPGTQRTLVPLDAPMALRCADGRRLHAERLEPMQFAGTPAPFGILPGGPTRDFNLMLRGGARGSVHPIVLAGLRSLEAARGLRWLAYLHGGEAVLRLGAASLTLRPGDAALLGAEPGASSAALEGTGEIILVKLYA